MYKPYRSFCLFTALALFLTACSLITGTQTETPSTPQVPLYETLLGKRVIDQEFADFIANNHCSSVMPYILCKQIGMALLIDSSQAVDGVFLYLNKAAGSMPYKEDFAAYTGQLPFGLKYYDNMAGVEYKLKRQGIGNAGLPDFEGTPDHMHYQATYQNIGLTIIYNSPGPDDDATIHAVFVSKEFLAHEGS